MTFPHRFFLAAAAGHGERRVIIFFAQVLLLIAVGRLLGEWMQRIGQPAVMGQLLAGWGRAFLARSGRRANKRSFRPIRLTGRCSMLSRSLACSSYCY
jgi:hypothetical protein